MIKTVALCSVERESVECFLPWYSLVSKVAFEFNVVQEEYSLEIYFYVLTVYFYCLIFIIVPTNAYIYMCAFVGTIINIHWEVQVS
jgi:hypothetical protein